MQPSVERVREIREAQGIGLLEAKRIAVRELLTEMVEDAATLEDLRQIVRELVRRSALL